MSYIDAAFICQNDPALSFNNSVYCFGKSTLPECNMKTPMEISDNNPAYPICFGLFSSEKRSDSINLASIASNSLKISTKNFEEYLVPPRQLITESIHSMLREINIAGGDSSDHSFISFAIFYVSAQYVYFYGSGKYQAFRLRDKELISLSKNCEADFRSVSSNITKGECQSGDSYLVFTADLEKVTSNMQLYSILKYGASNREKLKSIMDIKHPKRSNNAGILFSTYSSKA